MNKTLEYIAKKYNIDLSNPSADRPVIIETMGRDDLANDFKALGFNLGAEIGVQRGEYSEILCKANPNLKLFCIDAWTAYKEYVTPFRKRFDDSLEDQQKYLFDDFYEKAKVRLAPFDCVLIKKFSVDASKEFEDNSLDFVYIDASHEFQQVANDIAEWSKKVKIGGIISGHDYWFSNKKPMIIHVKDVVDGWTHANQIKPWFVFNKNNKPNWFWVKG